MALVAYGSSDEELSDSEEPVKTAKSSQSEAATVNTNVDPDSESQPDRSGDIPIEDDEYDITPDQSVGLSLPPPKYTATETSPAQQHKPQTSILAVLPAPKDQTAPIGFTEEDELEEEVKPKATQTADIPVPPSKQKKKQIIVPSLQDYDSDEEEPTKKKPRRAQGKSGLFSVLPPPKNSTTKEAGRVLLPHSLSKPKAAPKSTAKKTPVQVAPKLPLTASLHSKDDSDDDDDDNEGSASFFSLGQKDTYETVFASSTQTGVAPSSAQVNTMHEPSLRGPWLGPAAQASDLLGPALNPVRANNRQNVVPSEPTVEPLPGTSGSDEQLFTAQRHPDFEQNFYPEVGELESFLQDEEFLKLQGKKGRREEMVNIVDVHADDQKSTVDLMKHMTEEKEMRSFSKKGKDMPSSQQRRKHQITYLAFQAKERELELKNAWAQNRQTKRQTQSKYGF